MFIALNRKALKPILPDMATGPVIFVIAAHVACQQRLHELNQCGLVSFVQLTRNQDCSSAMTAMRPADFYKNSDSGH